jgi:ATP-binding cassette subfamily C protein LapB
VYRYKNSNVNILDGITLGVKKGEKVLIEGRIGTGKSTLMKLILRYKRSTSGALYLNGRPYSEIDVDELRSKIGYVPQGTILFNRSIYENIVYGNEGKYSISQIQQLVEGLDLSHIFDRFDNGLMTSVGKNGSSLSGGQRQIVWILRVLLQDPDVLLLDEPTASIDEDTKDIVYKLLNNLMDSRTVIMVTHDKTLEEQATRILYIQDGRITWDVEKEGR